MMRWGNQNIGSKIIKMERRWCNSEGGLNIREDGKVHWDMV